MPKWDYKKKKEWEERQQSKAGLNEDRVKFIKDLSAEGAIVGRIKAAQGSTNIQAAVVPLDWLEKQIANCKNKGNQETIRIVAGADGEVYIEMWQNPPGWGNDWPKVDV